MIFKLDGYTIYIAYSQIIEQIFQGFSQLRLIHRNITLPNSMHDKSIEIQPLPRFIYEMVKQYRSRPHE